MPAPSSVLNTMKLLKGVDACREFRTACRQESIALVPTMGALHQGHRSLIKMAKDQAERTVVSIFLNPLQFRPGEDLQKYPRPLEADLALCEEVGVDAVFLPGVNDVYPEGMDNITRVVPRANLTNRLCGLSRPGHFEGVATVVLKLFSIVQPDLAIFGEKDAQQLAIIRYMVEDLNLPVNILAHPTVRESNGLAVSSRNIYLETEEEKDAALILSRILFSIKDKARNGKDLAAQDVLTQTTQEMLVASDSRDLYTMEYLEAVNRETLQPVTVLDDKTKIMIAGHVGDIRMIDNMDIGPA